MATVAIAPVPVSSGGSCGTGSTRTAAPRAAAGSGAGPPVGPMSDRAR